MQSVVHVIEVLAIFLLIGAVSFGSKMLLYWRQRGEAARDAELRDRSHQETWLRIRRRKPRE